MLRRRFGRGWAYRVVHLACSASEGVAAGMATKRPVALTISICMIVSGIKLTLEALQS